VTGANGQSTCPACAGPEAVVVRTKPWADVDLWSCARCGTEFLDPQPSDARLAEIYGPSYYEPWGEESEEGVRRMKRLTMAPILQAAKVGPGVRVLDVGCATGHLVSLAVEQGAAAYGLDLNEAAVEQAAKEVPEAQFAAGTLADEPFPGVQFHAVLMVDLLEHVRDPVAELTATRARMAVGGRLVISTPRVDSLTRRALGSGWPQYREEHLTYLSTDGARTLLDRAGFALAEVRPTTKAVTPAYLYGQATAYPLPVLTPALRRVWPVLPKPPKHVSLRLRFGEMTLVAVPR
jgi:SAM-dependent methyltransferase